MNQQVNQPGATALLLFPTKALTNDQYNNFAELQNSYRLSPSNQQFTTRYPANQRTAIRKSTQFTNQSGYAPPGILPHHTNWARFFQASFIIIDEMHIYRESLAAFRTDTQIKRICALQCLSAIRFDLSHNCNPEELGASLIEQKFA